MTANAFTTMDIAATGLQVERARVSVIAQNIANASVTRTAEGGPYRRQRVLFETIVRESEGGIRTPQGGVRVRSIEKDLTPGRSIRDDSHPDAIEGVVEYPNVDVPTEMADLLSATRSYESNVAVIRMYREMMRQTMDMTR